MLRLDTLFRPLLATGDRVNSPLLNYSRMTGIGSFFYPFKSRSHKHYLPSKIDTQHVPITKKSVEKAKDEGRG